MLTLYQISLVYVILTTVLFLFPPELPVTGPNMSKLPRSIGTSDRTARADST